MDSLSIMTDEYARIENHLSIFVEKTRSNSYIIYPYGVKGRIVQMILRDKFGITPKAIVDERLSNVDKDIFSPNNLCSIVDKGDIIILCSTLEDVRCTAKKYIDDSNIFDLFWYARDQRIFWLENYSKSVYEQNLQGSVAECGVYKGDFAYYINYFFRDRKCYLIDSFEGFRESDIKESYFENDFIGHCLDTTVEKVKDRMINKKNVIIKKGFIPEAANGIEDEFCFVNLDMDIYQPMYEALKIFYPKLVCGGALLIHDYFWIHCPGVKQAVCDYEKSIGKKLQKLSIGDSSSIAIIKHD